MDTTSLTVWQSLLQTSSVEQLGCLSQDLTEKLQAIAPFSLEEELSDTTSQKNLSKIHYSWLAPFLRSLPESDIKLFLSPLPPEHIRDLKRSLLLSNTLPIPSPLGKTFLCDTLFAMIAPEDLLPASFLPEDPLNGLLNLTQEELTSLIDLLSMHDLSIEIRHVIETSKF